MNIVERIASLRGLMSAKGIDAYLIYGTDPHLSEYVPQAWQSRAWISGFTGSYGKVAITMNRAVLWTDSRYFVQAELQLSGTGIKMIKDRQADTISVDQWIEMELVQGGIVAVDGLTIPAAEADGLTRKLAAKGITLNLEADLVSPIWENRPLPSKSLISDYPVYYAGQSRSEKLAQIRSGLRKNDSDATLICQLDDLAWSFNLRGNDIIYNPLFTGYGFIDHKHAIIFTDPDKVTSELKSMLENDHVSVMDYQSIFLFIDQLDSSSFYLDPDRTNSLIYRSISKRNKVIDGLSVPARLKSIKNDVEIEGMVQAHIRDGAAMVNFLCWFDKNFGQTRITELSVAEKLRSFRSEQPHFMGESFSSIVGFGPHGAITHYSATLESNLEVLTDGILLFDSGGQYLDGTTDITRTIATGKVSGEQQSDFTLVLKGMIQLAKVIFPENTKGYSLDILARQALWNNGLTYGHGTGHGVGHFLGVHEGPMSIRPEYNPEPICAGQIITDEPGLYREGAYGIRIENVLVCKEMFQTVFGRFLSFETLTLCPIDRKLVKPQMLNPEELTWLNDYHAKVVDELSPLLSPDVLNWLKIQCAPICVNISNVKN